MVQKKYQYFKWKGKGSWTYPWGGALAAAGGCPYMIADLRPSAPPPKYNGMVPPSGRPTEQKYWNSNGNIDMFARTIEIL